MTNGPERNTPQKIGHLAEKAVEKVCAQAGFAVHKNSEDYGEDLLVQTCIGDKVDNSRLWLQVKGFEGNPEAKPTPKKADVKPHHLIRWIASGDLVIVVRWDTVNDVGWYMIPQYSYSGEENLGSRRSRVRIGFETEKQFDKEAVEAIAWMARMDHTARCILYAQNRGSIEHGRQSVSARGHEALRAIRNMLIDLGIIVATSGDSEIQITQEFAALQREAASKELVVPLGEYSDSDYTSFLVDILEAELKVSINVSLFHPFRPLLADALKKGINSLVDQMSEEDCTLVLLRGSARRVVGHTLRLFFKEKLPSSVSVPTFVFELARDLLTEETLASFIISELARVLPD